MKNWFEKLKFNGDKVILGCVVGLAVISILAIFTSTSQCMKHIFYLIISFGLMCFVSKRDYKKLSRFTNLGLLLAILLLIVTLTTGGKDNRGVRIGPMEFQSFYLVGFLVVFYIANKIALALNTKGKLDAKESWLLIAIVLLFCGGIAIANMSTAILLFLTSSVVFIIGEMPRRWRLSMWGIVLLGVLVFAFTGIGRGETFKGRVHYFVTKDNSQGYGDQIIMAKAAIARSGFAPAGAGRGVIKKSLPEKETDYVYATIVEEFGILGGLLILGAYFVIFYRACQIAYRVEGTLGKLLVMGIAFWLTCQAFVHIAVNIELCPATGQTLPFISRGGSSLLISSMMLGVLLNISSYVINDDKMNNKITR